MISLRELAVLCLLIIGPSGIEIALALIHHIRTPLLIIGPSGIEITLPMMLHKKRSILIIGPSGIEIVVESEKIYQLLFL